MRKINVAQLILSISFVLLHFSDLTVATSRIQAQIDGISEISWSPNGNQIAVGYWDGKLQIWDIRTGDIAVSLSDHLSTITALAWHPTENWLISSSYDELLLWDLSTGKLIADLYNDYGFPLSIRDVLWSPDGNQIIVFSQGVSLGFQIWEARSFQFISGRHVVAPYKSSMSPDATRIALVFHGGVTISDSSTFEPLVYVNSGGGIGSVAWSSDSQLLATSNWFGGIRIWNLATDELEPPLKRVIQDNVFEQPDFPTTEIQALKFSQSNTELYAVRGDGTFLGWNVANGELLNTVQLTNEPLFAVKFSPDGHYLALEDGTLKVIEVASLIEVPK